MDTLTLRRCAAREPEIRALIDTHFALMHAQTPPESAHVLPAESLDDVFMLAAETAGDVLGIGALAQIASTHGEIKSMHTRAAARGRGVARRIFQGLLAEAKLRGFERLSLETGSADAFAPAHGLYTAAGFTFCDPFGSYGPDPLSVFMTRRI